MYKIEIGNKTGEKREFECDGTANIYALFRELNITDYPYRLKVGQNKNGVSVRILADKSEYRGLPSAFDPRIYRTAVFYSDASIFVQCGTNQPERIYGRVADRAERVRTYPISRTRNVFVSLRKRKVFARSNRARI